MLAYTARRPDLPLLLGEADGRLVVDVGGVVHGLLDADLHLQAACQRRTDSRDEKRHVRCWQLGRRAAGGGAISPPHLEAIISLTAENRPDRPRPVGKTSGSWFASLLDFWDRCCSVLRAFSLPSASATMAKRKTCVHALTSPGTSSRRLREKLDVRTRKREIGGARVTHAC